MYFGFSDPEHVKRERRKAQELRKSSWWKQQVGPGRCHHCGEKFPKESLTLDHVIPLSRGGKSTKNNCVPACKPCNTEKGYFFSVEKTFLQMETDRQVAEQAAQRALDSQSADEPVPAESPQAFETFEPR